MTNFEVGQILTLKSPVSGHFIGASGYGWGGRNATIPKDTEVEIRKVGVESLWLRGETADGYVRTVPLYGGLQGLDGLEDYFSGIDPNAPKPRRVGEVPEGGIAPDDPRLAWLWEDAAKVASSAGHCREYDDLCAKLDIPGRERTFTVKHQINGLAVTTKIKARSQKQADEMVKAALA